MNEISLIEPATTDVIVLGPATALTVFGTEGGVDAILEKIRVHARAVETDISTPTGRAAVASLAYRIARSKTALDKMGKDLGDANYRAWKAISSERARIEQELDALRDEVRKPLTDWENAEKARVAAHEAALEAISENPAFYASGPSADYRQRLQFLRAYPARDWQEFAKRAADAIAAEIQFTEAALRFAEQREADAAERARRAEEEARAAREAEAERQRQRVAAAAENARREAEAKAEREAKAAAARAEADKRAAVERVEREKREAEEKAKRAAEAEARRVAAEKAAAAAAIAKAERERQEAEARAAQAEEDRKAAEAKAKADAERAAADAEAAKARAAKEAADAERQRIADKQRQEAADAAAREADRRHRGRINGEARDAFVAEGLSEQAATTAVTAIARQAIPHVRISY